MNVRKVRNLTIASLGLSGIFLALTMRISRSQEATFQGHTGPVSSVMTSPDGKTLVSVSKDDKTTRLWDVATRKERTTLHGNPGDVRSVAFSPNGNMLASVRDNDKTVTIWDVATGKERAILQGHSGGVRSVAFSPDGNTLASGSEDKTVKLWDVTTHKERLTLQEHPGEVWSVAFSPDGTILASGSDKTVKLWDVAAGKERATLQGHHWNVWRVAFSPDGKTLASVDFIMPIVRLWDVASGQRRVFEHPEWLGETSADYVEFLAFSADGKTLALGTDEAIGLWNLASGKNTATFGRGHRPLSPSMDRALNGISIRSVFFTPDGKLMALGSSDKTVKLWQVAAVPSANK